MRRLPFERNRVLIGRVRQYVRHDPELLCGRFELLQQVLTTLLAGAFDDRGERLDPFRGLDRIRIGCRARWFDFSVHGYRHGIAKRAERGAEWIISDRLGGMIF
jgi:hypothetical protein